MRAQLWENARLLKSGLRQMGFPMDDTPMPVAAWKLKSPEAMDHVHQELMKRGICIQRSHYVGSGGGGVLRAVVFSSHTPEQINRLLGELKTLV
jgi:glycine C-acetyltransferase/8-amino-7-oxononanoate synthase